MKNLFLTIVIFFIGTLNVSSQILLNTDGLNNLDNVFLFSLKQYCNSLDSLKIKTVYVMREHFIGESWPTKIKNFEIKYLGSGNEYKKIIKENGGHATIVKICPFEFQAEKFYISVIPFSATYSNREVHLDNGGGLAVYFEYDPLRKGLIYKTEQWIGI
jgi:hypothetical protein